MAAMTGDASKYIRRANTRNDDDAYVSCVSRLALSVMNPELCTWTLRAQQMLSAAVAL